MENIRNQNVKEMSDSELVSYIENALEELKTTDPVRCYKLCQILLGAPYDKGKIN